MRIRVKFSKSGPLRFIGNLDLHAVWERAARRAGIPLAYSHGFHPQPKMQLASPLPLGCSSRCELVDLILTEDVGLSDLPARLQAVMPQGIGILSVDTVDPGAPALPSVLRSAEYEITLDGTDDTDSLGRRIGAFLSRRSILRERRGKPYDLRPLVEDLRLQPAGSGEPPRLGMRLAAREGATGRPDQVLEALDIPPEDARIERISLIFAA